MSSVFILKSRASFFYWIRGPCCGALPWWDFRPNAEWIDRTYTVAQWLGTDYASCLLFTIVGVTILSVYPDWQHCKHLGIDKVIYGGCLYVLTNYMMPGSPEDNVATLWAQIKDRYDERGTPTQYSDLKKTMFNSRTGIKLKGKAAEVKHLGPILLELFQEYMNPLIAIHRQTELVLRLLVHLDVVVDRDPDAVALSDADSSELLGTCQACFCVWTEVSEHWKGEGVPIFGLTSKAHMLVHACILSSCTVLNRQEGTPNRGGHFPLKPLVFSL